MSRRIKGSEFLRQMADFVGLDNGFVSVDLIDEHGRDATGWVFLAPEDDELDALRERVKAAETKRDAALIFLDGREGVTAEEQLELFLRNGFREEDITALAWSERRSAMDRIATFRYRPGAAATA